MLEGRVAWSAATLLRALSYPHADRADDVAEAIAVRDGRGLLERFLDRYGQRLRLRGNGLAPARLRFGRCLLPTVGLISLSVDGAGVRVATRGPGGEHEVRLTPDATWQADGLELLPAVGRRHKLTLLAEGEPEIGFPPPGDRAIAPGSLGPETISSLEEALGLLGSAAPAYLRWVEWGLRDAVVVGA